jgi:hypothetical protein
MLLWAIGAVVVPFVVILMLFFAAAEDFWSIITFRVDFSRLIGDLAHVLFIIGIGAVAELVCLYMALSSFL